MFSKLFSKWMKQAVVLTLFSTLMLSSCGQGDEQKEEAKSMEQLQAENGIPVVVAEVQPQSFEQSLSFYATLKGAKESTKGSMVGDKIAKINVSLGQNVKEGDILVEFPTDNPAIQFTQAKAAYENAKKMYERMGELLKAGETSQMNYDNTETQYLVNKRNWEAIKQMLYIEAPISGRVIELPFEEGDVVKPGDKLFTVAQLDQMKAKIMVSQDEIVNINNNDGAKLEVGDIEFQGRVSEVALAKDKKSKAFPVEVTFANPGHKLKSGMATDIYLSKYRQDSAVVIPANLVQKALDTKFVYVVENSKAVKKVVKTGRQSGLDIEILEGLAPGEELIIKGQTLVHNGVKVFIKD